MDIRIGKVKETSKTNLTATVYFENRKITSPPLKVLQQGKKLTVEKTSLTYGQTTREHSHAATLDPWMPDAGDVVVCLITSDNGRGFVLGRIE